MYQTYTFTVRGTASANILFGVSIPVFKYLLTSDVPPEAITIMRAKIARMMFWFVSLFIPKEKVLPKDLGTLFIYALMRRGYQPMAVCRRVEKFFACRCLHYRYRSAYFRVIAGCRCPQRACYGKKVIRRISWRKRRSVARVQLRTYFRWNRQLWGETLILLNQLMHSVYLVLSKPLSRRYSSVTMMKWMFLFSTMVLAPFCLPHV